MPQGTAWRRRRPTRRAPSRRTATRRPASRAGAAPSAAARAAPTRATPRRRARAAGRPGARRTPATWSRSVPPGSRVGCTAGPRRRPHQGEAGRGDRRLQPPRGAIQADRRAVEGDAKHASGQHERGPREQRERALSRGSGRMYHSSGSGNADEQRRRRESTGEIRAAAAAAGVSRTARARRVRAGAPERRRARDGRPHDVQDVDLQQARGAWRTRRARTTAAGTETRSRKICQPRRSTRRAASPADRAALDLRRGCQRDGDTGEEEEERRGHAAEDHQPAEHRPRALASARSRRRRCAPRS